jgi:hypothetical protein
MASARRTEAKSKENIGYGPFAGVDYNLTLCPLQSRLQHIYHGGQPYARVDFIPQSGTLDLASERELEDGGGGGLPIQFQLQLKTSYSLYILTPRVFDRDSVNF